LHAIAVVKKHTDHRVTIDGDESPGGVKPAVVGLIAGSLVGLLGGPMGVAFGAIVGFTGGLSYTTADGDSASAFLDEVARKVGPSASAVIAEIEDYTDPKVDDRLKTLGGTVFRKTRDILHSQARKQAAGLIVDENRRQKMADEESET
jgi:uncharacterized membrane protein